MLIIFALFIFPLQVSWGAIETYCEQEEYSSSPHCMDCLLESQMSVEDLQDQDASGTISNATPDCSDCSVNITTLAVVQYDAVAFPSAATRPGIDASPLLSNHVQRPERPQWRRVSV